MLPASVVPCPPETDPQQAVGYVLTQLVRPQEGLTYNT
jgi:hypothetical protein